MKELHGEKNKTKNWKLGAWNIVLPTENPPSPISFWPVFPEEKKKKSQ